MGADVDTVPTSSAVRKAGLTIACMSSFITPFMAASVSVALPSIGDAFKLDDITLSWIVSAYLLAAAMFLVPFGRIADIHGRKKIFLIGIITDAVSSLVLALAPSSHVLIAFRVIQGIGGAMIFGTGIAILTSIFPGRERGRVLGISVAFVYLGLSLGPVIGGFLTQQFGWRAVFFSTFPVSTVVVVLVVWKLRGEWAEARGEKFDFAGSAIYGLGLAALVYGFTILPEITGLWMVAGGAGAITAFVWWETRAASPVLNIDLFRHNPTFTFSNLAALINYSATFAVSFLMSLYLQYIKGLDPSRAGLILIAEPVVMSALSPVAGRLSDKFEPQVIASAGMAISALGLGLLALVGNGTDISFILASLATLGLGFALFSSPNTNAVMSSVDRKFYGVASGTLGTMRTTGQVLSMGVTMMVFALIMGKVPITPANYPALLKSTRAAFFVFAALCFGGVFASLARGKTRRTA